MKIEASPNKGAVAALHVGAAELELIRDALLVVNPDDPDTAALAMELALQIERDGM